MKRIQAIEDVRSVSDFQAKCAEYIARVATSRRPLVLTRHGRGPIVILDVYEYQALVERLELLEDLNASETDLAESRSVSQAQAKRDLLASIAR